MPHLSIFFPNQPRPKAFLPPLRSHDKGKAKKKFAENCSKNPSGKLNKHINVLHYLNGEIFSAALQLSLSWDFVLFLWHWISFSLLLLLCLNGFQATKKKRNMKSRGKRVANNSTTEFSWKVDYTGRFCDKIININIFGVTRNAKSTHIRLSQESGLPYKLIHNMKKR